MNINESVKTIQEMKALCVTLMAQLTNTRAMLYRAVSLGGGTRVRTYSMGITVDEVDMQFYKIERDDDGYTYVKRVKLARPHVSEMEQIRADYNRLMGIKELGA